ncbi:acyltransferase [Sulfitobacter sp. KE29]|uniref:lysophospholipid acyltransferase family protein n=1 Tax=unclassified Sulfitobacter TaxID=196795 RepID=UPI0007C35A5B|nr:MULTISPECIES: lysophospholipid acyltransferase family protein [unclassified Sulfitobacter]KZY54226.1 acyltransferase [Sulfitobacter sp. HI0054]MBO9437830.1 lysophospholipid acyltransferase family protein [Sulfitobacter sp. R18_2]MDF3418859.1 acyltransferase [Sulfitobacter sp. Ks38]MDF3426056.1 acyltransferase [Sulfitobacter sp. KE29]MDF3429636.1 acyltransferase [Sulfitobacter sp. S46]
MEDVQNIAAEPAQTGDGTVTFTKYDRRSLSYASTFDDPWKARVISAMELFTGKLKILRLIRKFEQRGTPSGQAFWRAALDTMGIDLTTPQTQLDRIPKEGPVVVVANHPHGMVDGMIFADLIGRVRPDYRILTRSLLTSIDEVAGSYMIPVPFPHDPDAQRKGVEMRAKAMAHLKEGGVVALFPSGVVAASESWWGPAVEAEWNVFTAKMIRRSGAQVVPMRFPGQNSRAYQIANRLSPMLRQGLLLHEIAHACDKPQGPIVGHPLAREEIDRWADDPRGFMAWLRAHTLALTN